MQIVRELAHPCGTDGNGDGPSLAVALDKSSADMGTAADAVQAVVATVTITSDDDADKTAEITLAIACDSDITAPDAPAAAAATDGSHAFASVDIPTGKAGKCTFTATATLGGEEKSGEAEFTVNAAGDNGDNGTTASIELADLVAPDSGREVDVSFTHDGATGSPTYKVYGHCAATAPADAAAVKAGDTNGSDCADAAGDTTPGIQCKFTFAGTDKECALIVVASDNTESTTMKTVTLP